MKSNLL